ncbi:hypothetical protein L1D29_14515 [Shewanella insulae]|nr:hypothetical protein [Shewanella insulae]
MFVFKDECIDSVIHINLDLIQLLSFKKEFYMGCTCCGSKLNSGMLKKTDLTSGQKFKSCPHCSAANGSEHVFHPYPGQFGKTPARVSAKNPDGHQSYCNYCRGLDRGQDSTVHFNGRLCSTF